MAAQKLTVTLTRPSAQVSWGFRLQGGTDFATPLSIQLVQPGSVAAQGGLQAGDAVLRINGQTADDIQHDEAKQMIVQAGNMVEFMVQRAGVVIWKPKVTPMSELRPEELQTHTLPGEAPPIQKTSLASRFATTEPCKIGVAHNRAARPFPGSGNSGYGNTKPAVVHAQFNSPFNLYSSQNASDTYEKQTEALETNLGSLDVNDDEDSGDSKPKLTPTQLLLLEEQEAKKKMAAGNTNGEGETAGRKQSRSFQMLQRDLDTGVVADRPLGMRSVQAPQPKPPGEKTQIPQQTCSICGMLVAGVFVKVRGMAMHADCLRCAKCRKSLKHQGYFWVEDKMYCEQHAKELTQPAPDMVATAVYN